MKERILRRWHRHLGIILALFIIVQTGTGLFLTLGHLIVPHTHEHGTSDTRDFWTTVSTTAMTLHHGGGPAGTTYRILLGAGILIQTVLGTLIFVKTNRSRTF
ncbi:MAG: hypothetical protein AB1733_18965 [Thermodesulfobacteriota bacterium]